jgi:putative peptidoglycan lipid II flippase
MKRIFGFFSREISGIHHAAYILAISSLSSQLLALFRDRLLASSFGASFNLDLYYSAFRIPDLLFATVGSLVSASVLLPTVAEKFSKNKNDLKNFLDSIFSFYLVIILFTAILLIFISPFLLSKLFPSIKGQDFKLLVILTRILLFSPVFLGLSNLLSSIVQIHQRFFISALSPILYNIGIIFGILFMYPFFGTKGLVLGVVFGAVLHFLIQVPFVLKEGFFPKLIFKNINQSVKKIFYISLPRTITVSSAEISELFLISFASFLTVGSISIFNLSFNLQSVPFSIIGVSYAIAIFPTLSKHFACKEFESFLEKIIKTSSHIIFWSIPATVFIFIFSSSDFIFLKFE